MDMTVATGGHQTEGRRAHDQYTRRVDAPIPNGRRILARLTQICAVVAFVTLFLPNESEAFTLWDISVLVGLLSLITLAVSKLLANRNASPSTM
jgi:hypothetical protein